MNKAAYLEAAGQDLVIRDAPRVAPLAGEVLVKVQAAAINPVDERIAAMGIFVQNWPHIIGSDISGIVEEVGADVDHVKPGDHVFAICSGKFVKEGFARREGYGAFQLYSLCLADQVAKLPGLVPFDAGAVLPLGLLTSSVGLYDNLDLDEPRVDRVVKDECVLVWGGASSVGSNAVQLAISSGYHVITTASKHNFGYCKDLGAEAVFDYGDANVSEEILKYLNGRYLAGTLDAISRYGSVEKTVRIVEEAVGSKRFSTVVPGTEHNHSKDIIAKAVYGGTMTPVIKRVYREFVPKALEAGIFKAKPDPTVVGKGLEYAQKAVERFREGVSAQKVVFQLA